MSTGNIIPGTGTVYVPNVGIGNVIPGTTMYNIPGVGIGNVMKGTNIVYFPNKPPSVSRPRKK
jgi:hypothetical protein